MTYNVWITLHGSSAKTSGIVGGRQKTRSSWSTGSLTYVPVVDGTQQNYQIEARSDDEAWGMLGRIFQERNPRDKRPLAGKSYMRGCRTLLRKVS